MRRGSWPPRRVTDASRKLPTVQGDLRRMAEGAGEPGRDAARIAGGGAGKQENGDDAAVAGSQAGPGPARRPTTRLRAP